MDKPASTHNWQRRLGQIPDRIRQCANERGLTPAARIVVATVVATSLLAVLPAAVSARATITSAKLVFDSPGLTSLVHLEVTWSLPASECSREVDFAQEDPPLDWQTMHDLWELPCNTTSVSGGGWSSPNYPRWVRVVTCIGSSCYYSAASGATQPGSSEPTFDEPSAECLDARSRVRQLKRDIARTRGRIKQARTRQRERGFRRLLRRQKGWLATAREDVSVAC